MRERVCCLGCVSERESNEMWHGSSSDDDVDAPTRHLNAHIKQPPTTHYVFTSRNHTLLSPKSHPINIVPRVMRRRVYAGIPREGGLCVVCSTNQIILIVNPVLERIARNLILRLTATYIILLYVAQTAFDYYSIIIGQILFQIYKRIEKSQKVNIILFRSMST